MKKSRKGMVAIGLALVIAFAFASSASAFLYGGGWGGTPNISDSNLDGGGGAKDITGIWYANDGDYSYFRMDVAGTISGLDYANLYKITTSNGSAITLAYSYDSSNLLTAASFIPTSGSTTSISEFSVGGTTLEWKIPVSLLTGTFTYSGSTYAGNNQYDSTNSAATPIPSAAWLLGSGIIGLIGLQRRRAKRT